MGVAPVGWTDPALSPSWPCLCAAARRRGPEQRTAPTGKSARRAAR